VFKVFELRIFSRPVLYFTTVYLMRLLLRFTLMHYRCIFDRVVQSWHLADRRYEIANNGSPSKIMSNGNGISHWR